MRAPINVTENAANRIKEIIGEKTNIDGVRLGVRTRGCNGMSYTMNYVETGAAEAMDEKVEEHGVKVYIDPKPFSILSAPRWTSRKTTFPLNLLLKILMRLVCVDAANLLALEMHQSHG